MLKLLGVLLVVVGSAAFGFGSASGIRRQIRLLQELIARLQDMKSQIAYRMTPLPELLEQMAVACHTELAAFFTAFAENMTGNMLMSVPVAASMALECTHNLPLDAEGQETLRTFCQSLGLYDLDGQLAALNLAQTRLQQQLDTLEASKRARCRSYQTIGVCAGLAIAVILV